MKSYWADDDTCVIIHCMYSFGNYEPPGTEKPPSSGFGSNAADVTKYAIVLLWPLNVGTCFTHEAMRMNKTKFKNPREIQKKLSSAAAEVKKAEKEAHMQLHQHKTTQPTITHSQQNTNKLSDDDNILQ